MECTCFWPFVAITRQCVFYESSRPPWSILNCGLSCRPYTCIYSLCTCCTLPGHRSDAASQGRLFAFRQCLSPGQASPWHLAHDVHQAHKVALLLSCPSQVHLSPSLPARRARRAAVVNSVGALPPHGPGHFGGTIANHRAWADDSSAYAHSPCLCHVLPAYTHRQ